MFGNRKSALSSNFDTLIGSNTVFEGNIKTEGAIRIDGKVIGDIIASGDMYIGNTASITGNISAANIHLSGRVEGNINTKGILRLMSTARLYGDIEVNSFVADEGGVFQGKCSMLEAEKAAEKQDYIKEKAPLKSNKATAS